jgi:ribose 5-phosphate isomerase A
MSGCKWNRLWYHTYAVVTYGESTPGLWEPWEQEATRSHLITPSRVGQRHIQVRRRAEAAGGSEPIEGGDTPMSIDPFDSAKQRAAEAAAAQVEPGMIVGLGTGTTASAMVHHLGLRVQREALRIVGVATSEATATLARSLGIPVRDIDEVDTLDLNLDGADEIDGAFRMIKGRGGALLREKIVVSAARRRVAIITPEKRVDRLGTRMPIPVEVSPFGLRHIERQLRVLGAATAVRTTPAGQPFVTDGGHRIIDCHFGQIDDPEELDQRLDRVAGVFETGLFIGLCDLMIVGHPDRVEIIERQPLRGA